MTRSEGRGWRRIAVGIISAATLSSAQPITPLRVTYEANYQHLVDYNCEGPPPIIQLSCQGGALEFLQASDPMIRCERMASDNNSEGQTSLQCTHEQCLDAENCDTVYLEKNGRSQGGIFAQIRFQCESSASLMTEVDASMSYLQGEPGSCSRGLPVSRNYHVGQLGVVCPIINGNGTVTEELIQHDSGAFQCSSDALTKGSVCYTGRNCHGSPCKVQFGGLAIASNSSRLPVECIEGLLESQFTDPVDIVVLEEEQEMNDTLITQGMTPSSVPSVAAPTLPPTVAPSFSLVAGGGEATPAAVEDATMIETADAIYSARYLGRFSQVLTPGCSGSRPSIVVVCGGELKVTGTSDPSIQCNEESITLEDGRTGLLCENECRGSECDDIFVSAEYLGENPAAPFGQVYFTCSGNNIEDVDASFIISLPEPTECDGTDATGININVVQLGVVCPTADGLRYIIDDQYTECGLDNLSQRYGAGHYSCLAGGTCPDDKACQIEFEQLIVNADPHFFQDCIDARIVGEDTSKPLQEFEAPKPPPREPGIYSARFQAKWSIALDSHCEEQLFTKRVNCTNGVIQIIESSSSACLYVDGGVVDCPDASGSAGSIQYECTSESEIPETKVEFFASFTNVTECIHTSEAVAMPALQLGISCGPEGLEEYIEEDFFVECGESDMFDNTDGPLCFTTIPVPDVGRGIGLFPAENPPIFFVATVIMTDYRWTLYASDQCFTFQEDGGKRRRHLSGHGGLRKKVDYTDQPS